MPQVGENAGSVIGRIIRPIVINKVPLQIRWLFREQESGLVW
ncbi:MAG TPA: hypothetical protein VGF37_08845 [Chthoniobacterales bacterium]|jgi:hypothetical protein